MATKSRPKATDLELAAGLAITADVDPTTLAKEQRSVLDAFAADPGTIATATALAGLIGALNPAAGTAGAASAIGTYEASFMLTLIRRMHEHFEGMQKAGVELQALGDPQQLAERVAAAAPIEPSPLEEITGPFYDTRGLRTWLGTSRQALADRVKANTLLGLQTGDRTWVYPAWQFTTDRQVIPHLSEILRILATGTAEKWTWALWLTAPNEDWDEKPAWKWLAEGHDPEPVISEAHRDAAHWAA